MPAKKPFNDPRWYYVTHYYSYVYAFENRPYNFYISLEQQARLFIIFMFA